MRVRRQPTARRRRRQVWTDCQWQLRRQHHHLAKRQGRRLEGPTPFQARDGRCGCPTARPNAAPCPATSLGAESCQPGSLQGNEGGRSRADDNGARCRGPIDAGDKHCSSIANAQRPAWFFSNRADLAAAQRAHDGIEPDGACVSRVTAAPPGHRERRPGWPVRPGAGDFHQPSHPYAPRLRGKLHRPAAEPGGQEPAATDILECAYQGTIRASPAETRSATEPGSCRISVFGGRAGWR